MSYDARLQEVGSQATIDKARSYHTSSESQVKLQVSVRHERGGECWGGGGYTGNPPPPTATTAVAAESRSLSPSKVPGPRIFLRILSQACHARIITRGCQPAILGARGLRRKEHRSPRTGFDMAAVAAQQ